MANKDLGNTSTGIQPNVAALLCYLVGFITGIIFYLIEKENKFVRFHAMQSMIVFGFLFVLSLIFSFILPLYGVLVLVQIVLWVLLMVKAYQGEYFKLPVAGDIAEKNS